jgi:hypothetical protein
MFSVKLLVNYNVDWINKGELPMVRIILITFSVLLLTSCAHDIKPQLIRNNSVVFIPDDKFFNCPTVAQLPDINTLRDEEVAELLIQLDTNNRICDTSIRVIKQQLITARTALDNG